MYRPLLALCVLLCMSLLAHAACDPAGSLISRLSISEEAANATRQILHGQAGIPATQLCSTVNYQPVTNDTLETRLAGLACNLSELLLEGPTVMPSDKDYEDDVEKSWSQTCWRSPRCIMMPKDATEVSRAIVILSFLGTRFAVRSGGHSPNPGFSNIDNRGVLVDLSSLNVTSLTSNNDVLSTGPGNTWGDVYDIAVNAGRDVIGGRVPVVGVGGLLLGGGLSSWTGGYGMACDNVRNYEVVLANGSIVNANSSHNSDLFKGLKGGGPNFGIVTRFDLNTAPIDQVWYESWAYSVNQTDAVFDAFYAYETAAETDPSGGFVLSLSTAETFVGFSYPNATKYPDVFNSFYNLTPEAIVTNSTVGSQLDLMDAYNSLNPTAPARWDISAVSTQRDASMYKAIYRRFLEIVATIPSDLGASVGLDIQPVPSEAVRKGKENGGNVLGLAEESQDWLAITLMWTDSSKDEAIHAFTVSLRDAISDIAKQFNKLLPFVYTNDAGFDQNPLASYGAESLDFMRRVSRKYDPEQVFQKLQNGGYLLSRA